MLPIQFSSMNFKFILFLIIIITANFTIYSQPKDIPLSISFFNNGTSMPGKGVLGVWNKNVHPGIMLGYQITHKQWKKSELIQNIKLGYFYHRFAQQGIQLYTDVGYRYRFDFGLFADVALGGGYLHSFSGNKMYQFKNGQYEAKPNWGRPQGMISSALSIGYDLEKVSSIPLKPFIQYQFWMQTPFVKGYVPLLPSTALHIGVQYTFHRKTKNQ